MSFPFICPPLQLGLDTRDGDTMISVPAKSGTTWTMNIFHQLRTGGDADFADIYAEVPWAELLEKPGQTMEELHARWKALPADVPRAFKTHAGPGDFLHYKENLKYIVVLRNPEEAMVSFKIFVENHSREFFKLWGISEELMDHMQKRETFEEWYNEVALKFKPGPPGAEQEVPGGMTTVFFWSHIAGWWPLRNKPNVLFMHFSEMKKDHEGSIHKIADFLGFKPTAEEWPKIMEYTSFKWMKAHQEKFEAASVAPLPIMNRGAMVRKGAVGDAKADGMTAEVAASMKSFAKMIVQDDAAIKYMYEGGPIPPG
eukprot:m.347308 g.347308  ORF g.347308 m.347308 type:complete len:313 (+) comp27921_c0_seq1:4289-5227(+)